MRNAKLLRGPTVSQWASSSPSRATTRSMTLPIVSRSNSVIVPKEKVGQAHFLSKQIYDTFPTLRKQVSRPIHWSESQSPFDSSSARVTIRLPVPHHSYPAQSGPQLHLA